MTMHIIIKSWDSYIFLREKYVILLYTLPTGFMLKKSNTITFFGKIKWWKHYKRNILSWYYFDCNNNKTSKCKYVFKLYNHHFFRFYSECLLPELIDPQFPKRMLKSDIREPDRIKNSIKTNENKKKKI